MKFKDSFAAVGSLEYDISEAILLSAVYIFTIKR